MRHTTVCRTKTLVNSVSIRHRPTPQKILETKTMVLHQLKLSIASLFLGLICFSSCYHDAKSFFVPTAVPAVTANALRGKPGDSVFTTMTTTPTTRQWRCKRQTRSFGMMPTDIELTCITNSISSSSFHLSAVEVFDGSSIIDPVVVSGSFWSTLQRQITSVILGQLIATVVFGILVSFLAPQLSALRDAVLSKFTDSDGGTSRSSNSPATKTFIKADSTARPAPNFGKLLVCLLIDIVGTSSEALPIVGEFTDILTAPVAALILQNLFPGSSRFVFLFEFAEEILPVTDFIPFATICWVVDTFYPESSVADVFQLGTYSGPTVTGAEKAEAFDTSAEIIKSPDKDAKR